MTRKNYSPSTLSHSATELHFSCIHNISFILQCGENVLSMSEIDGFCLSYHFHQVLYPILPDVLDCNPFRESPAPQPNGDASSAVGSGGLEVPTEIQSVVDILADTWRLLTDCQLHQEVSAQLIGYLLFFISASLFNCLMEKGTSVFSMAMLQMSDEQNFILHIVGVILTSNAMSSLEYLTANTLFSFSVA